MYTLISLCYHIFIEKSCSVKNDNILLHLTDTKVNAISIFISIPNVVNWMVLKHKKLNSSELNS